MNLRLLFTTLAVTMFSLLGAQVANQPTPLELCDDDIPDGITQFDLTVKDAEILGAQSPVDFVVNYYLTQADADSNVNPLSSPYENTLNPQTIFVRVEDVNTGSFDTTTLVIRVNAQPELISIFRTFINDGVNTFDLTSYEDDFTLVDLGDMNYQYYLNLSDAGNQINAIDPSTFNQSGWVFVRADTGNNGCVSDTRALQFALGEITELSDSNSSVSDTFCYGATDTDTYYEFVNTDGGFVTVNFASGQVEDGWDELVVIDSDGTTNLNAATPYGNMGDLAGLTYQSSGNQLSFYIRGLDSFNDCNSEGYTPISFSVSADEMQTIDINQPTPLELCDGDISDEIEEFDLSGKNAEILGALAPEDFSVNYYLTQADADANINPLPILFTNTLNPQTIYVRVEDVNTISFDTTTLTLVVLPNPSPGAAPNLEVCDDESNDGFEVFDLTVNDLQILNGEVGITLGYFNTEADALFGTNIIVDPTSYVNITSSIQTIYVRVENNNFGCFVVTEFDIIVNPYPVAPGLEVTYSFCQGDSLTIDSGVDSSLYTIEWYQNGFIIDSANSPTLIVNQADIYSFTCFDNATGCASTVDITVTEIDCTDTDNDGVIDLEEDRNGNGNFDDDDTDLDSIPNYLDVDDDGDNVDTIIEINISTERMANHPFVDTDGDLIENYLDNDDDDDGVLTIDEDYNNNGNPTDDDTDMSGTADYLESNVALSVTDFISTHFRMFPVPATNLLTIQMNGSNFGNVTINIMDIQGKLISATEISEANSIDMDVSELQSGLYFVKVNADYTSLIKKLIIE